MMIYPDFMLMNMIYMIGFNKINLPKKMVHGLCIDHLEKIQNAWNRDTGSQVNWTNNETGEKMNLQMVSHPSQREYETITDLNHPLYGAIKNITKEECINTEAVDEYGETKKNFGTCNKSTYPYGDSCYFKKTFWGFEDKFLLST